MPFPSAHLGMGLLLKQSFIQPVVKSLISSCVLREKAEGNGKIIMSKKFFLLDLWWVL